MANTLINGFSAKTGGGKAILENYLSVIQKSFGKLDDQYYVLTPDPDAYKAYDMGNIHIISVPFIYYQSKLFLPFFYLIYLKKLIRRLSITGVLNFGDIVLPLSIAQVYFFDWSYAVYPESVVWQRMKTTDCFTRRLKLWIIRYTLRYATVTIAQIDTMAHRLQKLYGLKNVVTLPSPVTLETQKTNSTWDLALPTGRRLLLCLANYSPHKNIEILLPLAKLLKSRKLPITIFTTLAPAENQTVKRFLQNIALDGLEEYIINIGSVERNRVGSLFQACDGLLLPTLLESYGLPFVEAMFNERTIFTSDYDFARDVCGDSAYFFDPLDPESICDAIASAFSNEHVRQEKIALGRILVERLPSWDDTFRAYQACIEKAQEIFARQV